MATQRAIAGCSGGAIAGCHRSLPCGIVGGEGDDQLWGWGSGRAIACYGGTMGVEVVPLLGAVAGCQCDDQFWGSGRGHYWVPLQGSIVACYGGGKEVDGHSPRHPRKRQ